jgi:hypothetical protein
MRAPLAFLNLPDNGKGRTSVTKTVADQGVSRFGAFLGCIARTLRGLLSGEMRSMRLRDECLAHLATRGDHPFVGCNPSLADDPLVVPGGPNPTATPRPRSDRG